MTWTAAGSWLFSGNSALTVNNQAAGNLLLVEVTNKSNNTVTCTGLSGGGATWTLLGTSFSTATPQTLSFSVFAGTVTATGAGTATPSWSGTAPGSYELNGHEFHSTAGSWTFDAQGNLASGGTANWASLTPAAAGELYFGSEYNQSGGGAVAGSTSGYVYNSNANANGQAYNPSCPSGVATFPVWGDTSPRAGVMVLMQESGGAPAAPFYPARQPARSRTPQPYALGRPGLLYANSVQQVP